MAVKQLPKLSELPEPPDRLVGDQERFDVMTFDSLKAQKKMVNEDLNKTFIPKLNEFAVDVNASVNAAALSERNAHDSQEVAKTKAGEAWDSAGAAKVSEDNAKASEMSAEQSKDRAKTYVESYAGLSAEATTLESGTPASAVFTPATGKLALGIPKGDTGASVVDAEISEDGRLLLTLDGMPKADPHLWLREAGPIVRCYPVGRSPLDVTAAFEHVEIPPASGEKSPANPSTIQGTRTVKVARCGKNIVGLFKSATANGITLTVDDDGTCHLSGTATATAKFRSSGFVKKDQLVTVSLNNPQMSGDTWENSVGLFFQDNAVAAATKVSQSLTYTTTMNFAHYIAVQAGCVVDNFIVKPQIEFGSIATDYTPYIGDTYTVDLGTEVTEGTLDVKSGEIVETWHKWVLTGTESVSTPSGALLPLFTVRLPRQAAYDIYGLMCTHYAVGLSLPNEVSLTGGYPYNGLSLFMIKNDGVRTIEEWKAFLAAQYAAGTPVTVFYKLWEPTKRTVRTLPILALPQPDRYTPQANTLYSDAGPVTVGYAKSPIREHQDITAAILAAGGANV